MNRTHLTAAGAALAITLVAGLAAPGAAGAATKKIPVVTAHLGKKTTLSRTHLRPGRVTFAVHSSKGDPTLQIARLHKGYSLAQANNDINAGFGGNAAAIRRADANVTFYGGLDARKHKPRDFTLYLPAGKFLAINFDSGAYKSFTVSGSKVRGHDPSANAHITMLTYGFDSRPTLDRSGLLRLSNVSDQPHFLVLQHVKQGTTHAQVKKAFENDNSAQPKFLLKAGISSGVMSTYKSQELQYNLPAGEYVLACFWPDSKTGMEHAQMGMFKLVHLR